MRTEEWIIEQHRNTNHFYDTYLPYEFHLRMVHQVFLDFNHLLDDKVPFYQHSDPDLTEMVACDRASWGHDLIEDTRCSYNDVVNMLGQEAADIIYACSNEKGKNRKERANDKYYKGIRDQKGGVFTKLCDRIGNVQYSKMTKSRQFEMYKKENDDFMEKLGFNPDKVHRFDPMFHYLIELFKD